MKNIPLFWFSSFLFGVLLIMFSGCASSRPSRFYTLDTMKSAQNVQKKVDTEQQVAIGVGPVEIPDYLDRSQIVTRNSGNELQIAEFDRWAGSLREDIARTLTENLSVLLSQDNASVVTSRWGSTFNFRIVVNILRFDVMPDGNLVLKAQWIVVGADDRKSLVVRTSGLSEAIQGSDYSAKITAMSRALEMLSRDIADAIKPLIHATSK